MQLFALELVEVVDVGGFGDGQELRFSEVGVHGKTNKYKRWLVRLAFECIILKIYKRVGWLTD